MNGPIRLCSNHVLGVGVSVGEIVGSGVFDGNNVRAMVARGFFICTSAVSTILSSFEVHP